MKVFANVIGFAGVVLFVLSYQLKRRRGIIICNASSRVLYVIQHLLLGAYEGALLDVVAFFISLLCFGSNKGFMKKRFGMALFLSNVLIIGFGMTTYENLFSLLPILGVIFETMALWLKNERNIRVVSLLGVPFWLVYNFVNMAYGSCIGNVITLVSIAVAIIRYDVLGHRQLNNKAE